MEAVYVDHMGDDLRVVNSARVSFDKESQWEQGLCNGCMFPEGCIEDDTLCDLLSEKDSKLIDYLARNGHWTPFSHVQITMRETVPLFVARQRFKHMIGFTYNEVSRRYVDDKPEFFYPEEWRSRPDGSVKQGSGDVWDLNIDAQSEYGDFIESAERLYDWMIRNGCAPEQARMVLPQSMYTSYYVTGSLAAWARAYKQRIDAHAQREIQDLAKQWGEIIQPLFPVSWDSLTK